MSTPLRRYYRGHDLVGMRDEVNASTRYYRFDHQGTTQLLTDQAGTVTDRFAADAWGVPVKRTGSSINRHWYIGNGGYYGQVDCALDYVRARHLSFLAGRWLSRDRMDVTRRGRRVQPPHGMQSTLAPVALIPNLAEQPDERQPWETFHHSPHIMKSEPEARHLLTEDSPNDVRCTDLLYAYVSSNPTQAVDPSGHQTKGLWGHPVLPWQRYSTYGNYCGVELFRPAGMPPIDKLDGCCKTHDICYYRRGCKWPFAHSVCADCDADLCDCATKASCPWWNAACWQAKLAVAVLFNCNIPRKDIGFIEECARYGP